MTQVLAGAAGVAEAARLLLEGGLVAFGTETVYGLGADATQGRAVAAVFDAKGRPHFNPLICHYPDAAAAFAHVEASTVALRLAAAFWPGPLTMVLPRRVTCPVALLAGAGLETLAVRVPAHEGALALLRAVGRPVAAPSANRSGSVSPTTVAHVLSGLGGADCGGAGWGRLPGGGGEHGAGFGSGGAVFVAAGGVTVEAIEAVIGAVGRGITPAAAAVSRTLRSPGLLVSHYAPRLPLRLRAMEVGADEGLLAFGGALRGAGAVFQLSAAGDLVEAAAGLFAGLRWLDEEGERLGLRGIAAMAVPEAGLGLAINDRLQRAAAPSVIARLLRWLLGFVPEGRRALVTEFFRFGVVGASGVVVNTAGVYATKGLVGLYGAGVVGYFVAASWTWWFNRAWTFAGKGEGAAWRQWLWFMFVNLSGMLFNLGTYVVLIMNSAVCREYPVLAVAAGAVTGLFANFFLSRRLVFR